MQDWSKPRRRAAGWTGLGAGSGAGIGAALVVLLMPACVTHTRASWTRGGAVPITRTEPTRAWSLEEEGRALGFVVLFADPAQATDPSSHYFSVRNTLHQELGTVDALGRAWRFVPHQREATWVWTGTLVEGARQILGAGAAAELVELSVYELRSGAVPAGAPTSAAAAPHPRP